MRNAMIRQLSIDCTVCRLLSYIPANHLQGNDNCKSMALLGRHINNQD
jgi:hypothetical protein